MPELLPCPFCGRQPRHTQRDCSPSELDSHERSAGKEIHFVACMCGGYSARAHQFGYSFDDVAAAWNRRSPAPIPDPEPAAQQPS